MQWQAPLLSFRVLYLCSVIKKGKDTIPVYDICSLASAVQMQDDITVERFAGYLARHPDLQFPHRHSFWHLVYFSSGAGSHTIDFERFPVTPGQVYFMTPGQVHSWYFEGDVDGYIINLSDQLLHSLMPYGRTPDDLPFFSGMAADGVVQLGRSRTQVEALFEAVIAEAGSPDAWGLDMIKAHLLALFITVARQVEPGKVRADVKQARLILRRFTKLVEQHFDTMRLPKDYAAMLYITPNHLNALCNDLLGRPAGEVIRDRVLLEAKRLLVSSGGTVSEIAYRLHFTDNSYFTKFFKKYTSTTPEEFRASGKQ